MSRIKELPKSSSHLLTSTQIITSVYTVVKELIENSLDSSSKNVEIKLEDFGLEKIEIKDNGNGIHKDDIHFVAKPHCTSKINSHLDLDNVETYGFRGEALSALCAVSDLVITTKTADEDLGFTYTFDHKGEVLTSKPCPFTQGTTVTALNLFKNVPVRKQLYRNNKIKKEELRKIEDILVAFSCIQIGVRFALYHNRSLIWQKSAVNKTSETLLQVFGNSVSEHLENFEYTDDESKINIEVFLPRKTAPKICGQSSPHRSIIAINKRPVRMKMIDKILKEHYNSVSENGDNPSYPICYISINVPPSDIDVNFEPNKTAVAIRDKDAIVMQLSKLLSVFYSTQSNPETDSVTETALTAQSVTCKTKEGEIISPIIQEKENRTESSTKINLETEVPLVCMQQSQFISRLQNIVSKENSGISKRLSRNNNLSLPSSKRVKTSSSFSTPPNDIHRHLKTIDSFLSSVGKDGDNHPRTNLIEQNSAPTPINGIPGSVTVQRQNFNIELDFKELDSPLAKAPSNPSSETPIRKRHSSEPCSGILSQKLSHNDLNQVSSALNGVISTDKWSRGMHPVEKASIQPVTVLQPKVIENSDLGKEPIDVSPNQRKMTPFDFFCRKHRLEVASLNPEFSTQQIAQVLTEKWNHLTEEEKAIYKNMVPKEYPKNVKNKPKLGNNVSQNLEGEKPTTVKTKKLRKWKCKKVDKNITFNMKMMKESLYSESCCENIEDNLTVINSLSPGIWIYFQENKLYMLNSFRLQETIIYQRLLETYCFEADPLKSPYLIPNGLLNDDDMDLIMHMDQANSHGNEILISDERLRANGFQLKLCKYDAKMQLEILAMTKNIAFYGMEDLKEILNLIKEKGISTKLSDCRPAKVILYLQGEALRIARQCPASKKMEDIKDLLQERKSLLSDMCIHSKPFSYEICSMPTECEKLS